MISATQVRPSLFLLLFFLLSPNALLRDGFSHLYCSPTNNRGFSAYSSLPPSSPLPTICSRVINSASRRRHELSMSILPLSRGDLRAMSSRRVTTDQWKAYWGGNKTEKLQKVLESLLISYGGTWMAWFLSFMAGAYVSAFIGTALVFNWMYSPWLYAKKRNAKLWPRNQMLSYAVYVGRVSRLSRVRRRAGKTIGAVSQEFLVMIVNDENGRKLEIITQWQDSYKKLRKHMQCETIIASPSSNFNSLAMVTEVLVPACNVWVGDYPYLDRDKFKLLIRSMEKKGGQGKEEDGFDDEDEDEDEDEIDVGDSSTNQFDSEDDGNYEEDEWKDDEIQQQEQRRRGQSGGGPGQGGRPIAIKQQPLRTPK